MSLGTESQQGGWAAGSSPDGRGQFEYVADPRPMAPAPVPPPTGNPLLYSTLERAMLPTAADDD
jgi:Mn-containing catalase